MEIEYFLLRGAQPGKEHIWIIASICLLIVLFILKRRHWRGLDILDNWTTRRFDRIKAKRRKKKITKGGEKSEDTSVSKSEGTI